MGGLLYIFRGIEELMEYGGYPLNQSIN